MPPESKKSDNRLKVLLCKYQPFNMASQGPDLKKYAILLQTMVQTSYFNVKELFLYCQIESFSSNLIDFEYRCVISFSEPSILITFSWQVPRQAPFEYEIFCYKFFISSCFLIPSLLCIDPFIGSLLNRPSSSVKLNANRRVTGVLRGFDQFMNLVLEDCVEEVSEQERNSLGMVVSFCLWFASLSLRIVFLPTILHGFC